MPCSCCGVLLYQKPEVTKNFYLSGENVKDLFNRVSAICFDQAVLRELEDQKVKSEKVKLGGGSANSGLQTIRENLLLFLGPIYMRRSASRARPGAER